ncbi:MAG TPA: tRNA (adenosine(37)-N6)-threonylcarbamoyltransferase complex transferase subunit TsaD [Candidatus Krumholzibacteria bacterium]|nr:tRNA (adenosine(37)-N6)-threonylcarbamoyltransferase complex transferase subunit TsaD [Candidatus Krumholzibacteria bacterium]
MIVLGIETSCDDTSLALYARGRGVLANLTASQLIHEEYGGVVPEIASRQHLRAMLPVYDALLRETGLSGSDLDGVGVSNGPGLVGSLLVGVGFAKSLALGLGIPVVGVHHIEAHVLSNELGGEAMNYPCLVLVVSGGHTSLYLVERAGRYELVGNTRDDAAGEAFDKIAKLLGLGFPGGPVVQKAAERGNPAAIDFPRAMRDRGGFDFSFSGLKTAVRQYVESLPSLTDGDIADIAASSQAAIVEALVERTIACARACRVGDVYLAGGVAANGPLRAALQAACDNAGVAYHAPLIKYCMDNGAMVARTAELLLAAGRDDGAALDVFTRGPITSWT